MRQLPNGFAGEYSKSSYEYVYNWIPLSCHRQPISPREGDSSTGGGGFGPLPAGSPFSAGENFNDELQFTLLTSGTHPLGGGDPFMHSGPSSTMYSGYGTVSRGVSPSGSLPLPSVSRERRKQIAC